MTILTQVLDGIFFRLGWNGHDGKPSNKRIMWTFTLVAMVLGFLALSARSIAASQPFSEALALFGLGVLAAAGGHYVVSERQQLKDPLRRTPDSDNGQTAPPPGTAS